MSSSSHLSSAPRTPVRPTSPSFAAAPPVHSSPYNRGPAVSTSSAALASPQQPRGGSINHSINHSSPSRSPSNMIARVNAFLSDSARKAPRDIDSSDYEDDFVEPVSAAAQYDLSKYRGDSDVYTSMDELSQSEGDQFQSESEEFHEFDNDEFASLDDEERDDSDVEPDASRDNSALNAAFMDRPSMSESDPRTDVLTRTTSFTTLSTRADSFAADEFSSAASLSASDVNLSLSGPTADAASSVDAWYQLIKPHAETVNVAALPQTPQRPVPASTVPASLPRVFQRAAPSVAPMHSSPVKPQQYSSPSSYAPVASTALVPLNQALVSADDSSSAPVAALQDLVDRCAQAIKHDLTSRFHVVNAQHAERLAAEQSAAQARATAQLAELQRALAVGEHNAAAAEARASRTKQQLDACTRLLGAERQKRRELVSKRAALDALRSVSHARTVSERAYEDSLVERLRAKALLGRPLKAWAALARATRDSRIRVERQRNEDAERALLAQRQAQQVTSLQHECDQLRAMLESERTRSAAAQDQMRLALLRGLTSLHQEAAGVLLEPSEHAQQSLNEAVILDETVSIASSAPSSTMASPVKAMALARLQQQLQQLRIGQSSAPGDASVSNQSSAAPTARVNLFGAAADPSMTHSSAAADHFAVVRPMSSSSSVTSLGSSRPRRAVDVDRERARQQQTTQDVVAAAAPSVALSLPRSVPLSVPVATRVRSVTARGAQEVRVHAMKGQHKSH